MTYIDLQAQLERQLAERDAEIERLLVAFESLEKQYHVSLSRCAKRDAEIARLHSIIREMVRLSPDNPDVEDAADAECQGSAARDG
jgi:hypothetical protein